MLSIGFPTGRCVQYLLFVRALTSAHCQYLISDQSFSLLPHDPSSVARVTAHTIRRTSQGRPKMLLDVHGQGVSYRNLMLTAANSDFVWHTVGDSYRQATTISILPDNVLLEIFYFFKEENDRPYLVWQWQLLVHVCRKWRQVVLASPYRLDLRIFCSPRTPVGKNLGIWPALPLFIDFDYYINQRHGNNDLVKTTSLLHSSKSIVSVMSGLK